MERRQFMEAASAGRRLRVLVTSAMLFAVLTVTNAVISPSEALAATNAGHGGAGQVFYTTSAPAMACRTARRSSPSRSAEPP